MLVGGGLGNLMELLSFFSLNFISKFYENKVNVNCTEEGFMLKNGICPDI